jgi:hypothetical protein
VPERELAARLARVLDGIEPGEGETATLALLLEHAAASARIPVPETEVEHALAGLRPPVAPRRRLSLRLGLAAAGVAAAAVAAILLVVLSPFTSAPGLDVEAEAAGALGGTDTVLSIVLRVSPADRESFPPSGRIGWLDLAEGRARWTQTEGGRPVAETLVEPGSFKRYLRGDSVLLEGSSCRAFASGCAELVDPIALYRDALMGGEAEVTETEYDGRAAYRVVLPVQELPDAARVELVAIVDRETYLPIRISWRDVPESGPPRPFAVIDVVRLQLVDRDEVPRGAFELDVPPEVPVIEREPPGSNAGEARALTLEAAREIEPPLLWLGEEYNGKALDGIAQVDLGPAAAIRLSYADQLVVWNYTTVVPPEILARRGSPEKTITLEDGGVAHFYASDAGLLVMEVERPDRSVAIVAPELSKEDLFAALDRLVELS